MSATATLQYQRHAVNGKTTVVALAVLGSFPGGNGELVDLRASELLNPQAKTVTGPNGAPDSPPMVASAIAGWLAILTPTGGVAGQFYLSFWNGDVELTAEAYPAGILAGTVTVYLDHGQNG
jgi:hypothetical protein